MSAPLKIGKLIDDAFLRRSLQQSSVHELSDEHIVKMLWRGGDLRYRLLRKQREAFDTLSRSRGLIKLVMCSRRWGKTDAGVTWIVELAIKYPGAVLRYFGPSRAHLKQFVKPTFERVCAEAPSDLAAHFDLELQAYVFENGSICFLGSLDTMGDADRNVGTDCDGAVIDEAGIARSEIVAHAIKSVLIPQFATKPHGRVIVLSSAPHTPAHYLFHELMPICAANDALIINTIDDIEHVSEAMKGEMIDAMGGPDSSETRRELYCELVTDTSLAIVPEFNADVKNDIVIESPLPARADKYVAVDMGYNDFAFVGFAYYDFDRAKIIVVDELVFQYKSSVEISRSIIKKEREIWGEERPYLRIVDAEPLTIADMTAGTNCAFSRAIRVDKIAQLHRMRRIILERRIEIHPRCSNLINHLSYGVWNTSRTTFERNEQYGHFDGISMLQYLVHHIDDSRNPRMPLPPHVHQDTHMIPSYYKNRRTLRSVIKGRV